jgi:hypothetical protein
MIKKLIITAITLLEIYLLTSVVLLLVKNKAKTQTFHIDNINSGNGFRGIIDGYYSLNGENLRIHATQWRIRFGCGKQKGRVLDSICFTLGTTGTYWGTTYGSYKRPLNKYIEKDKDIILNDLEFIMPISSSGITNDLWLVATYENSAFGRKGWNYAHSDMFIFTNKKRFKKKAQ